MESNFGSFDPTSDFNLIVLLTICYPGLGSAGRLENQKNLSAWTPI